MSLDHAHALLLHGYTSHKTLQDITSDVDVDVVNAIKAMADGTSSGTQLIAQPQAMMCMLSVC